MEISIQTKQAYSEIDEFLTLLDEKKRNEVPSKLREFFKKEKDNNYNKGINPNIPIENQNLKKETLALIALLNLQYWCKDENEKQRLKQIYANNEKQYQKELRERYNPDNMFKNKAQESQIQENKTLDDVAMVKYKETLIRKIINKIKNFFYKKN